MLYRVQLVSHAGLPNDPIFCAFLMEGMVISAMDVIVSLFLPLCLSYDMGYQ